MYRIENPIAPEKLSFHRHCLWDSYVVNWGSMKLYVNGIPVQLPLSLTVPLRDKIKTRRMMTKDKLDLQFMIKQGANWYNLTDKQTSLMLTAWGPSCRYVHFLFSSIPSLRLPMASSRHSRSTYKSAAKSLKHVTAGGLEGVWDTKRRCVSLELPVGVTSIQMVVEGVDGVHTMDFSSFECAGSFVQWKDYDYPWKTSDFMLAREARCHGCCLPVASSQAYPRHRDIVRFENPTWPPFLRGGQCPWRGQSYSPLELPYTPHPISRPCRSKSHSPVSGCRQCTPIMGVLMARPRDRSGSPSSSGSLLRMKTPPLPLGRPDTPAPGSTAQGGIVLSPNSTFTPVCCQSPTLSPSPFYDFIDYRMEERSFLSSLCDEIGTVGDLQSVAASLGFKFSRVEQILTSFPHDFPAAVFATLVGWYTASCSMFCEKLDDLEEAFKEMHKGTLFNRIVNAHLVVLQRVSLLPWIRWPNSDTLDESLGEAVMNAVEIIPSCHLCLIHTLLWEILSDGIYSPWWPPVVSPRSSR